MRERYQVVRYESDGSGIERTVATVGRLEEARAVVRERLGLRALRAERRWVPMAEESAEWEPVEAYHDMLESEPGSEGCGGYSIERAVAH